MPAAGNIVGEVGLLVKPVDPAAQFQAGVDQIIRRLEKQAQFQVKASGLDDVEKQANTAGQAFANAAIQAAGLTAAIYGIRAGIEGAIGKLSGLFDQLAQARAGFTSILKSEAAGGQLLDDIREFARVSPFVTQELVNYSQQLLGVGLAAEQIIPLLKSTGDIISSVGGDTANLSRVLFTLTQIKSIGVLKGQDTMQLQNSLIPITKYLSEYLHKSAQEIVKLRESGLITADTVFAALNQQGEKVQGAMDKATRNIAGARAILSDTITQLFQDQPVLNKIFEDVFTSIANLANRLGEEDFQQAFAQFFDGVDKLYDGVKPLVAALGELADGGVISGLQFFGTALGAVGTALSAIPQSVMEAFARLLLALGALKAPLLLIAYVRSIATMASAILPASAGLANLGRQAQKTGTQFAVATTEAKGLAAAVNSVGVATEQAAIKATAAQGKIGLGGLLKGKGTAGGTALLAGSLIATIGGGILSGSDDPTKQTAGGALQGAGIGASVGALGGPLGAGIGAALGAALGGITSFMAQSEAKAKAHAEELKRLGEAAAEEFITAEGKKFGDAPSSASFASREAELQRLNLEINGIQSRLSAEVAKVNNEIADLSDAGILQAPKFNALGLGNQDVLTGDARKKAEDDLALAKAARDALVPETAAIYDPITAAIAELVEGLDKGSAAYDTFTKQVRGGRGTSGQIYAAIGANAGEIRIAEAELAKFGFTLEDIKIPEKREQFIQLTKAFEGLTTTEQAATTAAIAWNTALKSAKEATAQVYDPLQQQITDQIAQLALAKAVADTAFSTAGDPTNRTKQLQFEEAISKIKEDAVAHQKAADDQALTALKQRLALESAGKPENKLEQAETISREQEAAVARQNAVAQTEEAKATQILAAARASLKSVEFVSQYDQLKATADLMGSLFEITEDNTVALNASLENVGRVVRQVAGVANSQLVSAISNGVDPLRAQAESAAFLSNQLELVQLNLDKSDAEFASILANIGIIQPTFEGLAGTFNDVATQLGVPKQQLADILGIIGQIPTDLKIVINADGTAAIEELRRVKRAFDSILSDGERHGLGSGDAFFDTSDAALKDIIKKNTVVGGTTLPTPGKGAADNSAKEAEAAAERLKRATDALADKLTAAAESIVDAAKAWVGSIKERTQYEQAISAGTAVRNTQRQIKDLTELSAGLVELRARGLSEEAIKSLGIDNVADVRQVRKLLRANPGDIAALSAGVAQLTQQSQALAASEEDKRTQRNIAEGIIAAAETLEIDFSKPDAAALASTFHITATSDADAIAAALISALSSGRIGR